MNTQWKNILVPIDFTEESREALRFAVATFARRGQRITLMHVVEPEPWLMRGNAVAMVMHKPDTALRLEAHERLWRWAILERIPDDCVDVVVTAGSAAREIVRRARLMVCDAIVLARRREPAWPNASAAVVRQVQHTAPCAVLTLQVGKQASDASPRAPSPAPLPTLTPERLAASSRRAGNFAVS